MCCSVYMFRTCFKETRPVNVRQIANRNVRAKLNARVQKHRLFSVSDVFDQTKHDQVWPDVTEEREKHKRLRQKRTCFRLERTCPSSEITFSVGK